MAKTLRRNFYENRRKMYTIVKHAKHDLRQAEPDTTILQLEYDGSSVLHVRVDLNHHKVKIFTIHRGVCPECAADVKENLAKLEIEKDYIFLSNF